MMKNKLVNMFAVGLFLVPLYRGEMKVDLVSPTPTSTTVSGQKLIKVNAIKEIQMVRNEFKNKRGEMMNVKVASVNGDNLTVISGTSLVKVNIQSGTHFRRRFWGKSSLSEIKVGDFLDIVGKWSNDDKTEMSAVLIRNLSVQKKAGVFFGKVKTISDSGFVISTINKEKETVMVSSSTKIINREGAPITLSDIVVEHNIRIRGVWDGVNNTISEVTEIKDFNLPVSTASSVMK